MGSTTVTLVYFDKTNNRTLLEIKGTITKYPKNPDLSTNTENQEEIVIDSVKKVTTNLSFLRNDVQGKTFFDLQVGKVFTLKQLKDEAAAWAALAGLISSITITNGGTGYTTPPTLAIVGDGTGATATCTVNAGVIDSVTVTAPGSGYTTASVTVTPTSGGSGAVLTPVINSVPVIQFQQY